MSNKDNKTSEMVKLCLPAGLSREEVWAAYKEATCKHHEYDKEDFIALMGSLNMYVNPQYRDANSMLWEMVYAHLKRLSILTLTQGKNRGSLNHYSIAHAISALLDKGVLVKTTRNEHGIEVRCTQRSLLTFLYKDSQRVNTIYRGKASYEGDFMTDCFKEKVDIFVKNQKKNKSNKTA